MAISKIALNVGTGIDGRNGSESPWLRLENLRPRGGRLEATQGWSALFSKDDKWTSGVAAPAFPQSLSYVIGGFTATLTNRFLLGVFDLGDYFIAINLNGTYSTSGIAGTGVYSGLWAEAVNKTTGDIDRVFYNFNDANVAADAIDPKNAVCIKSGRRIFVSGGTYTYCVWIDEPPPTGKFDPASGTIAGVSGATKIRRMTWGSGVAGIAFSYFTNMAGTVMEIWRDRLWFAGHDGREYRLTLQLTPEQFIRVREPAQRDSGTLKLTPSSLSWSDAGDMFSAAYTQFEALSNTGKIVAMKAHNDYLFIFTESDIWMLSGNDETDFSVTKIASGIGCDGKWSCCDTPYGVVFTHKNRVYAVGYDTSSGASVVELTDPIAHLLRPSTGGTLNIVKDSRVVYSAEQDTVFIGCMGNEVLDLSRGSTGGNLLAFDFGEKGWFTMLAPRDGLWLAPFICESNGAVYAVFNYSDYSPASFVASMNFYPSTSQTISISTFTVRAQPLALTRRLGGNQQEDVRVQSVLALFDDIAFNTIGAPEDLNINPPRIRVFDKTMTTIETGFASNGYINKDISKKLAWSSVDGSSYDFGNWSDLVWTETDTARGLVPVSVVDNGVQIEVTHTNLASQMKMSGLSVQVETRGPQEWR